MSLIAMGVVAVGLVIWILVAMKRKRERRELEQHSIEPEALHGLLTAKREVLLLDVRQPLDLLADSEIIPGAIRIPPKEILANPSLIPREKDAVVYCTCPSDRTSRTVVREALALQITRIKVLRGGLAGWKAKGFEVEPYRESFHLDTAG